MKFMMNVLLCVGLFSASSSFAEEAKVVTPSVEKPVGKKKTELTLALIKPNAVKSNHIGDVISQYEKSGLRIAGLKMGSLSNDEAAEFYRIHKDRPFFNDLVNFMTSGPIVILAIEGPDAVARSRALMGATDPEKADKGTLRQLFGESLTKNALHGSDSVENATDEVFFFFEPDELSSRF